MDKQRTFYRSSKSRLTKSQLDYNSVNSALVEFIKTLDEPKDAEFIWSEIIKKGHKMSMSSFYGRLKLLVIAGCVLKTPSANKRYLYQSNI